MSSASNGEVVGSFQKYRLRSTGSQAYNCHHKHCHHDLLPSYAHAADLHYAAEISSACFAQRCYTDHAVLRHILLQLHLHEPSPLLSQLIIELCLSSRLGTAGKAVVPVSISLGGPELLRGACPRLHCSLHMTYLGHRYPVSAAPTAPLFDPPLSLQRHALVAGSSCIVNRFDWIH